METLQRTANRGSISTGYEIDNSCKFEDDNDEWLYRTNVSGTNTKTWTVSWWFKQTELRSVMGTATNHWTGGAYGEATRAGVDENDRLWIDVGGGDGNPGSRFRSLSTARLRDTAAWYHVVIACDSTQSTEADRLKVWLNGVEVTVWDQHQIPTLNFGSALAGFAGIQMKWGSTDATYGGYSGYLAECHYLDGVAKVQTDFGEYDEDSGIWKPKAYAGSYGGNGCYLNFDDSASLGADSSGNGNNFTLNNITSADQATDTPTNNFCTLNPLHYSTWYSINQGATNQISSANGWGAAVSSVGVTRGKWYFETYCSDTAGLFLMGVIDDANVQSVVNGDLHAGDAQYGISYYASSGAIIANAQTQGSYSFPSYRQDIMGCALDLDNGYLYFSKNGTWGNSGDPTSGSSGTGAITLPTGGTSLWYFSTSTYYAAHPQQTNHGGYTSFTISSAASDANGYGTFEYAPPSGYYALCTKNLEEFG